MKVEDLQQKVEITLSYLEAEMIWCVLHDYLKPDHKLFQEPKI